MLRFTYKKKKFIFKFCSRHLVSLPQANIETPCRHLTDHRILQKSGFHVQHNLFCIAKIVFCVDFRLSVILDGYHA